MFIQETTPPQFQEGILTVTALLQNVRGSMSIIALEVHVGFTNYREWKWMEMEKLLQNRIIVLLEQIKHQTMIWSVLPCLIRIYLLWNSLTDVLILCVLRHMWLT